MSPQELVERIVSVALVRTYQSGEGGRKGAKIRELCQELQKQSRSAALTAASEMELLLALRNLLKAQEWKRMTRSEWAEARHVIRQAYQELNGLHTALEVQLSWTSVCAELEGVIGSLQALVQYLSGPVPRHDAHTYDGPAKCPRCTLLRENRDWMEGMLK